MKRFIRVQGRGKTFLIHNISFDYFARGESHLRNLDMLETKVS